MQPLGAWLIAALIFAWSAAARAQPSSQVRAAIVPDGTVVRLVTTWGDARRAELRVGDAAPKLLHSGAAVGTLTSGHGKVLAALAVDHARRPFRVYRLTGDDPGEAIAIARPVKRRDVAFAVVATPTPQGFSIFFQEIQSDDPTSAHTYLVKLDKDAKVDGEAKEVAVPWALGAAIWNGRGYHLALFYGGGEGVRLSMVSLNAAGSPEQHPDWASEAGHVHDVHLVAEGERIVAFFAGGAGGDRLRTRDVTTVGQWGQTPSASKDLGALSANEVIVIDAKGRPKKVDR